jgi:TetR/AcrR family transcriptional repressor of nem operon
MTSLRANSKRRLVEKRDGQRTRARLLDAAYREIYRAGFRSADMDAILATAGVTKGALYYHFENKDALGYAVIDEVITDLAHKKWVTPLKAGENPIDALIGVIQSTSLKPEDVQCGCALNNLSQEMSPVNEGFRTRTAKIFALWTDAMTSALRRGQQRGLVKGDVNPGETATFLIAAYEGYLSLAKNSQDVRLLKSGLKAMTHYLESLRATPEPKAA